MAWETFPGHEGTTGWVRPEGAHGCFLTTGSASYEFPRLGGEAPPFYLTCDPVSTTKIRILWSWYIGGQCQRFFVKVEAGIGGGGQVLRDSELLPEEAMMWWEVPVAGTISGLTITFLSERCAWGTWRRVRIACAQYFVPECSGPLKDICAFLRQVGTFFIDLSLDIAELWLIGGFLSGPFELLGELFYAGVDTCCQVSARLQTLLDTATAGITPTNFLAFILENWPTLYYLITDPTGWFLVQLTQAFNLEPWHTQSLEFLAKWILETYFPALYTLWLDLAGGFLSMLEIRAPLLYYLIVDPEGEIRYLIGQWFNLEPYQIGNWDLIFKALMERFFPILWELYLDPEAWLAKHVDPRVLAIPTAIAAFLDDPWGWLFDRLEDQTEAYADRIGEIALKIIARLLGV